MKKLLPFVLIAGCALGLVAWRPASRAPSASLTEGVLEEAMETMNGCMKFLGRGATAENKDKALETIARMQAAVLVAKLEKPKDVASEELAGYRKMLVEVLASTCRLESALLDDKFEEAGRIVKEDLGRLKKDGHDKYQKE